ncbi:hypothetical protein BUALT_Bualt14G0002500 [Buddleja alternifolia]|uniref:Bidirectional sugar transporter SWEET n=1 Tax=Buddleja alternifolia TaxID=168488 RepID=A0AAV6WR16_9LAMI|nr:hypothetical protein BUALT_Bualt14G0002500 [Buddleja alternifolia]
MALVSVKDLAFVFGLLGNIVSFLVFLAPVPAFYTICKRKSSEGFQSIPYSVAFFSASLLLYYALLKTNAYMIVCINGIGCVIEAVYLLIYVVYAPRKAKIFTIRLIILFNIGGLGLIIILSILVVKGSKRVTLVGWTCAIINLAVFAAPLSIMRQVIRTKSVEFMPFALSFFLTLCATMWFFYGFFVRDYYIALPNVLGFLFGIAQMILYFIYKEAKKDVETKFGEEESVSNSDDKDIEMNSNSNQDNATHPENSPK